MTSHARPRIHAKAEEMIPRIMVRAMFGLTAVVLLIVTVATLTDRPVQSTPPQGEILTERAIVLTGDASGAARVLDATGTVIADFASDKGGFVAGIERVIARERAKIGAAPTDPVLLRLRAGNRLSLYDPVTGWSAELMGFGASNTRTFARLLDQP
ncbi:photosynthetic complex assembly protein PuhC [uncultured Roseobacter sp.]|uniref:photosynthetic complex assembly protein PuhC n=1 Tax=uncultured Roseobacter sp. TaxID=114847 RepID=UPI0026115BC4|nr:photosynthetic complex assembly protein PuhC [uncultured Roseobacter sp.]